MPPPLDRRGFLGLAAGLGIGVLAGCSGSAGTGTGGPLVVLTPELPAVLNPLHTGADLARVVTDPVVETLYAVRDDTTLRPVLASADPRVSADALTWTVPLRPGARFGDGTPLTAGHVAACLRYAADPATAGPWAPVLAGRVADVAADGDLGVRITLTSPYGLLRELLALVPVVAPAALGDPAAVAGTGPYRLAAAPPGGPLTLVRNEHHAGAAAPAESIEFRALPDARARAAAVRSGDAHVDVRPGPALFRDLTRAGGVRTEAQAAPVALTLVPNCAAGPFADLGTRRALAYATDRRGVVDTVFHGLATPGQGPIGPGVEGWNPTWLPYGEAVDAERVKVGLGEAGRSAPVPFTLLVDAGDPVARACADVLVPVWRGTGFAPAVTALPAADLAARVAAGEYDLTLAHARPAPITGRTAPGSFARLAATGYRNGELDRLLAEARAAPEASRRARLAALANEVVVRDAVLVPVAYPKLLLAQSRDVARVPAGQLALGRIDLVPSPRPR